MIKSGLLHGESLIAVYDLKGGGTGFIGLTTKRLIIQDNSFAGGRSAIKSIPYSKVNAVGYVTDKSFMGQYFSSAKIGVAVGSGGEYICEFRGDNKAKHAHDVILWHIMNQG